MKEKVIASYVLSYDIQPVPSLSRAVPGISRQHRDAKAFFALDIKRAVSASAVSPLLYDNLSFTNKTIAVSCESTKKSFN